MDDELKMVVASAKNGLTRVEIEALLGHRLDEDELTAYNKYRAIAKLQKQQQSEQKQDSDSQQVAKSENDRQINFGGGRTSFGGIRDGMEHKLPALHRRISKNDFVHCIEQNCGITTAICNQLDCTYTQYWNAVKKWGLEEFVKEQKRNLVSIAELVISELMNSKDEGIRFKSAQYILKSLARETWGDNPQVALQVNANSVSISDIFGIPPKEEQ